MAIITYRLKSGRGRPRKLDTEAIYEQIERSIETAIPRLKEFRKSSGYRGEKILGSETSLPDWVTESLDILNAQSLGREISPAEAESIRQTALSLKELSSKQQRVYGRSLEQQLTSQYLRDLDRGMEDSHSEFRQQQIESIMQKLSKMTPRQRQEFIQSQYYQDPKTATGEYKRVREWARKNSGRKRMSMDEAWAYLLNSMISEYMEA